MDCREAQERILEFFAETRPIIDIPNLKTHLAGCEACRNFAETQFMLDFELTAIISAPPLSPGFRASVMKRFVASRSRFGPISCRIWLT